MKKLTLKVLESVRNQLDRWIYRLRTGKKLPSEEKTISEIADAIMSRLDEVKKQKELSEANPQGKLPQLPPTDPPTRPYVSMRDAMDEDPSMRPMSLTEFMAARLGKAENQECNCAVCSGEAEVNPSDPRSVFEILNPPEGPVVGLYCDSCGSFITFAEEKDNPVDSCPLCHNHGVYNIWKNQLSMVAAEIKRIAEMTPEGRFEQ